MDLYTLTDTFLAKDDVDQFVSAIWTERYSTAGEVSLVVPATAENLNMVPEGTYLGLRGTKEVMQITSVSIENQLMTCVGSTLVASLNQRMAWFKNTAYDGTANTQKITDYTDATKTVGAFLCDVVDKMVIHPVAMGGAWAGADLSWANEVIPNLIIGAIDAGGGVKRCTIPIGPLYDAISQLADKELLGISLYLDSADINTGYVLKFTTYRGVDHTSGSGYPLIRLVPDMETISDVKEVRSIAGWKNVAYVYYQSTITKHLATPALPEPLGLDRRVLMVTPTDEPVAHQVPATYMPLPSYVASGSGPVAQSASTPGAALVTPTLFSQVSIPNPDIVAFRAQAAADAFANNNYIRAVDGQSSPINQYKYGVDYGLGDLLELQGLTGLISTARVTEYIRAQDATGQKEYPTIAVVS